MRRLGTFVLNRLIYHKAKQTVFVNGGRKPFILTVDKSCLFCYLKMGCCKIRDFLHRRNYSFHVFVLICIVNMIHGNVGISIVTYVLTPFRKVKYAHFRTGHRMRQKYRLYSPLRADTADIAIFSLKVCIR